MVRVTTRHPSRFCWDVLFSGPCLPCPGLTLAGMPVSRFLALPLAGSTWYCLEWKCVIFFTVGGVNFFAESVPESRNLHPKFQTPQTKLPLWEVVTLFCIHSQPTAMQTAILWGVPLSFTTWGGNPRYSKCMKQNTHTKKLTGQWPRAGFGCYGRPME